MNEKEYALRMLDEIRNRDGIGYNDYSDLWDAISEIPVEGDNDTDCKFCHEDSDGYVFPLEKNGHVVVRLGMDGWTLGVKYGTWRKNIRINYCPMCGRRLKNG